MEILTLKELVKRAKKEKRELLDLFKEFCEVMEHPQLSNKIKVRNLIVQDYLDKQFQIEALDEKKNKKAEELQIEQEINGLMGVMNLYCLGVTFEISGEKDYNLIYDSGIYDYVRSICAEDMDKFINSINRDIQIAMSKGAADALLEMTKSFGDVSPEALEKTKQELQDILQSETYKKVSSLVEKLN